MEKNLAMKTEGSFQKMSVDEVSIWLQKGQKFGCYLKHKIDFNIKDLMHEILLLFSIEIVFVKLRQTNFKYWQNISHLDNCVDGPKHKKHWRHSV